VTDPNGRDIAEPTDTAEIANDTAETSSVTPVASPFAHASEAEMARILDFYAVRWEYEPNTFPILWNLDGAVIESFAPDFYLPDLDLYLEMTTLKQRLVRKKNRKLRRLRELYPSLRIKLFYARDFRALLLKYGKLALVDELSGTPGQVISTREVAQPAAPVVDPPPPMDPGALAPASMAPAIVAPALDEPAVARRPRSARRRRAAAARRAAAPGPVSSITAGYAAGDGG
jgi:hypothetical protein